MHKAPRCVTLLGILALFATSACTAKEPDAPAENPPAAAATSGDPSADSAAAPGASEDALTQLATSANQDPVATVPGKTLAEVAHWELNVAPEKGVWIIGWDADAKNVITWVGIALSLDDKSVHVSDIVYGAPTGSSLTAKQVIEAYLADAKLVVDGTSVKPSNLFFGTSPLIDYRNRYCNGLNSTMNDLVSNNIGAFGQGVVTNDTSTHCTKGAWYMPTFLANILDFGCADGAEVTTQRYNIERLTPQTQADGTIKWSYQAGPDSYWQCTDDSMSRLGGLY
jgi:hypothetical protein